MADSKLTFLPSSTVYLICQCLLCTAAFLQFCSCQGNFRTQDRQGPPPSDQSSKPTNQNNPSQPASVNQNGGARLPANQITIKFQDGTAQQCDEETPCPSGYQCMYSHFVPGVKACYTNVMDPSTKPGRCPLSNEGQGAMGCGTTRCYFDQDCPGPQNRCCYLSQCGTAGRFCTGSVEIDPAPRVTVILDGERQRIDHQGTMYKGTVALVQSNGKNYLWETGTTVQKIPMIKALRDKAGISLADINMVLTSHGHPEHNANLGLFPDTDIVFDVFVVHGSKFKPNPFYANSGQRYFANNDQNLEILRTPGHTHQDTALLVSNIPDLGTVALVGDLIMDETDLQQPASDALDPDLQRQSRRKVLCLANYIVPGHGKMFPVNDQMRQQAGGCQGMQVGGWSPSPSSGANGPRMGTTLGFGGSSMGSRDQGSGQNFGNQFSTRSGEGFSQSGDEGAKWSTGGIGQNGGNTTPQQGTGRMFGDRRDQF